MSNHRLEGAGGVTRYPVPGHVIPIAVYVFV
jgi:hypothetical protein